MLGTVFRTIWSVITLPFRLIGWVISVLGRLTGLVLGFVLMVAGMAVCAGPLIIFGVPVFLLGLLLMLRSLG